MTSASTTKSSEQRSSESRASVLINISTPGGDTPICRLGSSEEIIGDATVRQLIERVINPKSLLSVGVPMSQLQAEGPTALAIGELLSTESCEVVIAAGGEEKGQIVGLDEPARAAALEQVGTQGNRFINISLEVRTAQDAVAPGGKERRAIPPPEAVEAEHPSDASQPAETAPEEATVTASGGAPAAAEPQGADEALPGLAGGGIMTIVAEETADELEPAVRERKEYVRKGDWLRAQFLPEVEALDLSGLFVGNLGLGVRQEGSRRNVVCADPSRVTDILLRANGYRRSGDHAKALICYQELVDVDPDNADFRFLLGKTLLELGQREQAAEALIRAKEMGHAGAAKELAELNRSGHRSRQPLGFLRFWKQ